MNQKPCQLDVYKRQSVSTTGSEVTYETHIPAAETAAAKRTGQDHLFRLLFCGRHRDADFLPAPVRFQMCIRDRGYAEENRNIGEVYRLLTLNGESQLDTLFEALPSTHPAKAPYSLSLIHI